MLTMNAYSEEEGERKKGRKKGSEVRMVYSTAVM